MGRRSCRTREPLSPEKEEGRGRGEPQDCVYLLEWRVQKVNTIWKVCRGWRACSRHRERSAVSSSQTTECPHMWEARGPGC